MADDEGITTDVENIAGEAATRDFTEVTYDSWGSKMKDSCAGVLIGFLLFFGSGALLFWNEGRAISRAKDLDEGQENVLSITLADLDGQTTSSNASSFSSFSSSSASQNLQNKLIHIVGPVTTDQNVTDPVFGVSAGHSSTSSSSSSTQQTSALKLRRSVEMFQWIERTSTTTTKTAAGGTRKETTYSYDKTWSSYLIDSYQFREQQYPPNPTALRFDNWHMTGEPLLLGGVLELQDPVANRINWYEPVTGLSVEDIPDATLRSQVELYGSSGFYVGNGTNAYPQIGDERIQFAAVPADTVSIVGIYKSGGNEKSIGPFPTKRGGTILFLERGVYTAEELFLQAEAENEATTWGLRFLGFFLMFISVLLILQPFATAVDIIPFVGDFLQGGMESCLFPCVAFLVAAPISLFIIALAWIVYRPYIAIPLLVVSVGAVAFCCVRARNKKNELESQQQQSQQQSQSQQQQSQSHYQPQYQPQQQQQVPVAYATPYGNVPQQQHDLQLQQQQQPYKPAGEPDVVVGTPYKPAAEPDVVVGAPYKPAEPDVPVGDFYKPDWAK